MKDLFTYLALAAGVIASILWLCSALVRVKKENQPMSDGWTGAEIRSDGNNHLATVRLQSRWNTAAAAASAAAGLCQVIATWLS